MKRREFIIGLGSASVPWSFGAFAQKQAAQMRRIGVLIASPENDPEAEKSLGALLQGLQDLGWKVGINLLLAVRYGGGQPEQIAAAAAELVAAQCEVLEVFMNEDEREMYRRQGLITDTWIKGSKHDVTVVSTLDDVGAEAYFKGECFFCKASQVNVVDRTGGGDAFDAGFLDAWLDQCPLDACLKHGLRSAAIVLGQTGPQYRKDT